MKKEVVWDDLGYMAMFEKTHKHFVDFNVYRISQDNLSLKTDIFLHGHTKYDSCSNIDIDALDEAMLHFCEKQEMINIGILLGRIYDEAFKMMPEYAE